MDSFEDVFDDLEYWSSGWFLEKIAYLRLFCLPYLLRFQFVSLIDLEFTWPVKILPFQKRNIYGFPSDNF